MGKRKAVTTRDIAEAVGLSQSTVSMILSDKEGIPFQPETRKKVWDMAAQLGYHRKEQRKSRVDQTLADTILVFVPQVSGGYYSMMIHSIIDRAKDYGYNVLTAVTFRDTQAEIAYLDMIPKISVAGVICLYPVHQIQRLNKLSYLVPVVSVGDMQGNHKIDSVLLNSITAGHLICSHLVDLGHRKICYITTPATSKEQGRTNRLKGIKLGLTENGLSEDALTVYSPTVRAYEKYPHESAEYQNGYDLTKKALAEGVDCTAFIGNNDACAIGILNALKDSRFRVPLDYSVCGMDNSMASQMPLIQLTTVDHAAVPKAYEAVDLIRRKHETETDTKQTRYTISLEYKPEVIVRKTTARPKKA